MDADNESPKRKIALAIMTKAPFSGHVKTRLTPPLTPAEAAELNRCFLSDIARALTRVGAGSHGVACFTPVEAEHFYASLLPPNFRLIPQRGGSLEDRLRCAFADLFALGFDSVCLIGSDSPTIPLKTYITAVEILRRHEDDVVVGPADDGGYYLIGLNRPHPELFDAIDWSTERVLDQTLARAAELRLRVQKLPSHYDVDDSASFGRLCHELLDARIESAPSVAPVTRTFLQQLVTRLSEGRI